MSRSIATQTETELGGTFSVLTRQRRDHIHLDLLLRELAGATGDRQDAVLRRLYRLVFPHAFAEESVLWPVMRRRLPDGEALTLEVEQEHQEVNELVTRLETLEHGCPERAAVLDRLAAVLREDVRDEEDVLLPRLQERVSVRQLRVLGLAWEVVRRIAPTRAHPIVARRPPGNVIAALPLSVVDRLRDVIDARGWSGPSRVLTRAAHAIERAPFMRSGEHPSTHRS